MIVFAFDQGEPARQISTSNTISFEISRPDTHTHKGAIVLPGRTTKLLGKDWQCNEAKTLSGYQP